MAWSRTLRAKGMKSGQETRSRIIDAALQTIKQQDILGPAPRAIARTGGFTSR